MKPVDKVFPIVVYEPSNIKRNNLVQKCRYPFSTPEDSLGEDRVAGFEIFLGTTFSIPKQNINTVVS